MPRKIEKLTPEQKKLFLDKVKIWWNSIGLGGVWLYTAWHTDYPTPIGFVTGHVSGNKTFNVGGSYVVKAFRRKGVRSKINEQLFKHFDVIETASGSEEGGKAFLEASGYKFDRVRHIYSLIKPTEKRNSKAKRGNKAKKTSKRRRMGKRNKRN